MWKHCKTQSIFHVETMIHLALICHVCGIPLAELTADSSSGSHNPKVTLLLLDELTA